MTQTFLPHFDEAKMCEFCKFICACFLNNDPNEATKPTNKKIVTVVSIYLSIYLSISFYLSIGPLSVCTS